jgi:hypothetical protein
MYTYYGQNFCKRQYEYNFDAEDFSGASTFDSVP